MKLLWKSCEWVYEHIAELEKRLGLGSLKNYDTSTGTCRQMGGDAIYATNANRRFATKNQISTSLIPKGKQPADEDKKQE